MRYLTIRNYLDDKTFESVGIVYLDDLKTDINFSIEPIMDAVAFQGLIVLDAVIEAVMTELRKYDLTQEEEKEYKEFFENKVARFR